MDANRKLGLKKEHIKELTMDELYAIIGDQAEAASVLAIACVQISNDLGANCGIPTCGPGCTAISVGSGEIEWHTGG